MTFEVIDYENEYPYVVYYFGDSRGQPLYEMDFSDPSRIIGILPLDEDSEKVQAVLRPLDPAEFVEGVFKGKHDIDNEGIYEFWNPVYFKSQFSLGFSKPVLMYFVM